MKNLNPNQETCRRNGVFGLGLVPGYGPSTITIKVSHGQSQYEVAVPFNSTFGYLKCAICQKIGLNPGMHKLLFKGKDRENDEFLQAAGVKDNSVTILVEDVPCQQDSPEEVKENSVISKGEEAVADVRKEVDKLEQQVFALEASVDRGTKVDDKEIVYLTEMLMRQLLKLDDIEAGGEGRAQRKKEVRRVQSLVEKLDALKSRNSSKSFTKTPKKLPKSTHGEAFNPGCESMSSAATTRWENFYPACETVNPPPPPPPPMPSYAPPQNSYCTPSDVPYYSHYPSTGPYYASHPPDVPYCDPSTVPYYSMPPPAPYPYPMPPNAPYPAPSTHQWQHFG